MIIRNPSPVWAADGAAAGADTVAGGADTVAAGGAGADTVAGSAGDKVEDKSFLAGADDDKIDDKTKVVAPADWPDDWRDKLAGGDAAARKRLDRFKAPTDIFKSYTELEGKFKAGKPADDEPMPDGEKEPEKLKEWRKSHGIPDEPTGYVVPDTVKALVTDADKPRLAAFTEAMHAKGIPTSAAGAVMEWYFQEQDSIANAVAEADLANKESLTDELRSEWGSDFRANSTLAKRGAEKAFPGVQWEEARLPDGRRMGDVPDIVRALADYGRTEFGDVSFANSDSANKTMARKQELETMMAEDMPKYRANPKLSQEYQDIIDAELKAAGSRGGGNHSAKPA